MVRAALTDALADVPTRLDPVFGLAVPTACPNVPADVLDPRATWADAQAYDAQASRLAAMFAANFRAFESMVMDEVRAAGPRIR
jgi:phosphoenolpyruvate carboxykinase (ATP)